MKSSRMAIGTALVSVGLSCSLSSCADSGGRPVWMGVIPDGHRPGVISATLSVADDDREIRAAGRAVITVEQYSATDSGYAVTVVYRTERTIKRSDFRPTMMLLGTRLLCDLGEITSKDMEKWRKAQGAAAYDNTKRTGVRVVFATDTGVTLNASSAL